MLGIGGVVCGVRDETRGRYYGALVLGSVVLKALTAAIGVRAPPHDDGWYCNFFPVDGSGRMREWSTLSRSEVGHRWYDAAARRSPMPVIS